MAQRYELVQVHVERTPPNPDEAIGGGPMGIRATDFTDDDPVVVRQKLAQFLGGILPPFRMNDGEVSFRPCRLEDLDPELGPHYTPPTKKPNDHDKADELPDDFASAALVIKPHIDEADSIAAESQPLREIAPATENTPATDQRKNKEKLLAQYSLKQTKPRRSKNWLSWLTNYIPNITSARKSDTDSRSYWKALTEQSPREKPEHKMRNSSNRKTWLGKRTGVLLFAATALVAAGAGSLFADEEDSTASAESTPISTATTVAYDGPEILNGPPTTFVAGAVAPEVIAQQENVSTTTTTTVTFDNYQLPNDPIINTGGNSSRTEAKPEVENNDTDDQSAQKEEVESPKYDLSQYTWRLVFNNVGPGNGAMEKVEQIVALHNQRHNDSYAEIIDLVNNNRMVQVKVINPETGEVTTTLTDPLAVNTALQGEITDVLG